jgi:nucleotide-binding universal stress UspA family protein
MSYKHLLVHVDSGARAAVRVDLAAALSRRLGARLTALFAELNSLGASLVSRRSPQHMDEARRGARALFEGKANAASLQAEWWELPPGEYGEVVPQAAASCRYADLAIVGQPEADGAAVPEDFAQEIALGSGRPVLVVPSFGQHAGVGRRVLVAWNGSREAARALNDALPFMVTAEAVTVLAFVQPGSGAPPGRMPPLDIAAHLAAHGIAAAYERITEQEVPGRDDEGVVHALLNRGYEMQADLTVMGFARGLPFMGAGVAKAMLRSLTSPLLLSS